MLAIGTCTLKYVLKHLVCAELMPDLWPRHPQDMAVRWHAEFLSPGQEFASDETAFLRAFASAWTKLMNADRFRGPAGSVCPK